jgi:hypothetical protein
MCICASWVACATRGAIRRTMGWRNTSFRGFADYMQTPDLEAGSTAVY